MSAPTQKTDILLGHIRAGDWRAALSLAATFKLGFSAADRAAIVRAHEAGTNPGFYRQLRRDPEALMQHGREILLARYGARV